MVVDPSDLIGRELAIAGHWEPQVTAIFRALLSPGDVCIDVGANVGYFTLLASQLVGPTGHVYALEPSSDLMASLRRNLELNTCTNVSAILAAASERAGEAWLHEGPAKNRGQASIRKQAFDHGGGTRVPTRRIDSIVADEMVKRVRLVKIDVEGSELKVLRGLEGLLERGGRPAIVVELTPVWSGDGPAIYLASLSKKYRLRLFGLQRDKLLSGRSEPSCAPLALTTIPNEQEELLLLPEDATL